MSLHLNAITLQGAMLIAIVLWAYWLYLVKPSDKVVIWSVCVLGVFGSILAAMNNYWN